MHAEWIVYFQNICLAVGKWVSHRPLTKEQNIICIQGFTKNSDPWMDIATL